MRPAFDWPRGISDASFEFFAFLAVASEKRFRWGESDCVLFLADWCEWLTGNDPATGLRGTYGNRGEAQGIIDAAGGPVALIEGRLRWPERAAEPQVGDGAVLILPAGPTAAVRGPGAWWGRSLFGVGDVDPAATVTRVWACPL